MNLKKKKIKYMKYFSLICFPFKAHRDSISVRKIRLNSRKDDLGIQNGSVRQQPQVSKR